MKVSTILKWVTGVLEALLGIPIIGAGIIVGLLWTPLFLMLILHIVTLIFSVKDNVNKHGSILGIVTSCIAWIPFVGMVLHIITAILLMIDAAMNNKSQANVSA
ncbi:hypothetical protein [Rubeoparvulum massiliense]|uniref:hypothetical protein n=1 Tax=Rubeoparvulum massiliense TaxID=1631346 RepID=UPI00065DFAC0|nr:hypothetical protein [Rubeoparvulum massiliense]